KSFCGFIALATGIFSCFLHPPNSLKFMKSFALLPFLLLSLSFSQKTATVYLTRFDESARLQETSVEANQKSESTTEIIDLNESATDQQAEGFGFALTQGSAQALSLLAD